MSLSEYVVYNGIPIALSAYSEPINVYYEVMRLLNGSLLYADDHLDRLNGSLKKSGCQYKIQEDQFQEDIKILISRNGLKDQNVKCAVFEIEGDLHRAMYYVPSVYPNSEMISKGIFTKAVAFERHNPLVKQMSQELQAIRSALQIDGYYDYICYDQDGYITEGTKANVFFVINNELITAPDEAVLGGITRAHVIALATCIMPIVYRKIHISEIISCTGAFFTGTSIAILPIVKIDDHILATLAHDKVKALQTAYQKMQGDYIRMHQVQF